MSLTSNFSGRGKKEAQPAFSTGPKLAQAWRMAKSSQTIPEHVGHMAHIRRASIRAGGAATSPLGTEQDFSPPREVGPTCPAQPASNTKSTANYPTLWQISDFPAHLMHGVGERADNRHYSELGNKEKARKRGKKKVFGNSLKYLYELSFVCPTFWLESLHLSGGPMSVRNFLKGQRAI